MKHYKCQCCGGEFAAREADRKRGWARYCSKSCKAVKQEARTGQYKAYVQGREAVNEFDEIAEAFEDPSWDSYKGYF